MKPKLTSIAILAIAMAHASGCGLRAAKQEQKAREAEEAARRTSAQNEALSRQRQDEAARQAASDLGDRVRYLRAIEGDYEGQFETSPGLERQSVTVDVSISIRATNLPAPFEDDRAPDPARVQTQMEALGLMIDITETSVRQQQIRHYCSQTAVKPDYERGLIRVSCGTGGAGGREFTLTLDPGARAGHAPLRDEPALAERSRETSRALIAGRLDRTTRINVRINSPFGRAFHLSVERE
jgi:hypothetical protein